MATPGLLIAGTSSNSGKTVTACALMAGFQQLNKTVRAGKCGPDYIDPMFHRSILVVDSVNLDLFFLNKEKLRTLYRRHEKGADISIVEGVMGYYDGSSLGSVEGSSYEIAKALELPVILVVPCKGVSTSILPVLKGMVEFKKDSRIRGIILNHVSEALYPRMKQMIECGLDEMGYSHIRVVGYLPDHEVFSLKSRHLGLVTPNEIDQIKMQLEEAGRLILKTVDFQQILDIASEHVWENEEETVFNQNEEKCPIKIAVARDKAFCFYYHDNLEVLKKLGCELVEFRPLEDTHLPSECKGLVLGGGYPELYAEQLSKNQTLMQEIYDQLSEGMPCLAECGGFLYLQEEMENQEGIRYPMVGYLEGSSWNQGKLTRFGYINVEADEDGAFLKKGEHIKGHEFHHWDSDNNGVDCTATKPNGDKTWKCMHMKGNVLAGFPHLYYASNKELITRFVERCREEHNEKRMDK